MNSNIMHSTYFTLPMGSAVALRDSYIEACADYLNLPQSEGMLSFYAGEMAQDIFRSSNDRRFQLSMHQIFKDRASFDAYGNRHAGDQFVKEVTRWAPGTGRRVYDSTLRCLNQTTPAPLEPGDPPRLMHAVYFTLADASEENTLWFMDQCNEFLSVQKGIEQFSVGSLLDLERDVSISNFEVAMNQVFSSKAMYFAYLKSPEHHQFLANTKGQILRTDVFDTYIHPSNPKF